MRTPRTKYPRTPHLPWSRSRGVDDVGVDALGGFVGCEVVATEKLDGENTSFYREGLHARSVDSGHHPSRAWVKGLHGRIAHDIPAGWRLCGENVFAVHSIVYERLESYFYLFSVWTHEDRCLSWDETIEWAELLGVPTPPVLYRGPWDEVRMRALSAMIDTDRVEGYVVRIVDGFAYDDFAANVAKWVRPHHVQTSEHWMHAPLRPNGLK